MIGPEVPLTGVISAIPAAIQNAWNANVIVAVAAGNAGIPARVLPEPLLGLTYGRGAEPGRHPRLLLE